MLLFYYKLEQYIPITIQIIGPNNNQAINKSLYSFGGDNLFLYISNDLLNEKFYEINNSINSFSF